MDSIDVLVVEDEDPKRRHIDEFLWDYGPSVASRLARSVTTALDAIDARVPDLMLLDMSLPTFDVVEGEPGGRPQGFGGLEIVRNMSMSDLRFPTLIITGYEAFPTDSGEQVQLAVLEAELKEVLGDDFLGVLHFNSALDDWKTELAAQLDQLTKGRQ